MLEHMPLVAAVPVEGARLMGRLAAWGLRSVTLCADAGEAVAMARAGLAAALILPADQPWLDRQLVSGLATIGVPVIALTGVGRRAAKAGSRRHRAESERLAALGVRAVLPVEASASEAVRLLVQSIRCPASAAVPASAEALASAEAPASGPGRVIAVWGPIGAPGRSTVAMRLSRELSTEDQPAMLIDADTYGPSLARRHGLPVIPAGLALAAHAANTGTLSRARLAEAAPLTAVGYRLLSGLADIDRWRDLHPAVLEVIWRQCRDLAAWTVIDCGFCLEAAPALPGDFTPPQRNQAALSAVAGADHLVAVGSADPLGLDRLADALRKLHSRSPSLQPRIVLTPPRTASADWPEAAIERVLTAGAPVVAWPGEGSTERLSARLGIRPESELDPLADGTLAERGEGALAGLSGWAAPDHSLGRPRRLRPGPRRLAQRGWGRRVRTVGRWTPIARWAIQRPIARVTGRSGGWMRRRLVGRSAQPPPGRRLGVGRTPAPAGCAD